MLKGRIQTLEILIFIFIVGCLSISLVSRDKIWLKFNIVTFGNSLTDNGNYWELTNKTIPSQEFYFQGRQTNGRVWVEYLASSLHANLTDLAYQGAVTDIDIYKNSTTDNNTVSYNNSVPSVAEQVKSFFPNVSHYPPHTLYIFWTGSNDYANIFNYNLNITHTEIINSLLNSISLLSSTRTRKFLILNLPPLHRTPHYNNNETFSSENLTHLQNLLENYNIMLNKTISNFIQSNKHIFIKVFDTWGPLERIINNPQVYGLKDVENTCLNISYVRENEENEVKRGIIVMASTLAPELFRLILKDFEYNSKALFSFSLVSRHWCRNVMPFLWKRPFNISNPNRHYIIMKTFLKFLPEQFRNELILEDGDENKDVDKDLNVNKDLNEDKDNKKKNLNEAPLFDYLSFLQEIRTDILYNLVRDFELKYGQNVIIGDDNDEDDYYDYDDKTTQIENEDNYDEHYYLVNEIIHDHESQVINLERNNSKIKQGEQQDENYENCIQVCTSRHLDSASNSNTINTIYYQRRILNVIYELFKYLFGVRSNISRLILMTPKYVLYPAIYTVTPPEISYGISKIKELEVYGKFAIEDLLLGDSVIKYCKDIEKLTIKFSPVLEDHLTLSNLIEAQRNLKHLFIFCPNSPFFEVPSLKISSQSKSLRYVSLHRCCFRNSFPLKELSSCSKLDTFMLFNCFFKADETSTSNITFKTPISTLILDDSPMPENYLTNIILGANSHLLHLTLRINTHCYPDIWKIISMNCPNLVTCVLRISSENMIKCNQILENCKVLEKFTIIPYFVPKRGQLGESDFTEYDMKIGEILRNLGSFIPSTLTDLIIADLRVQPLSQHHGDCFIFTNNDVLQFLKNCKATLRHLVLDCLEDHYLEVQKYIQKIVEDRSHWFIVDEGINYVRLQVVIQ
ncbi:10170_t:CDS:2 [Diversispora eburnea]|uniref:10170_t:CDS:1 n=1 Tax=Diversispora eburnea TaxID=1213867 RepID=A0A9N8WBC9_9GLOM|nr:10170_t:CDS:2 [Diversispora eburnea]